MINDKFCIINIIDRKDCEIQDIDLGLSEAQIHISALCTKLPPEPQEDLPKS